MEELLIDLKNSADIINARRKVRELAKEIGFGSADQTRLATAVSELTRNVIQYAGEGICRVQTVSDSGKIGLHVEVEDFGPGINDIDRAMEDGFTTGNGLGAGLPGTKRLVTSFDLKSQPGLTKITIELTKKIM